MKGYIYGKCGQREKAERYIAAAEAASAHQFVFASKMAITFLGLGQKDSAFVWLARAVDQEAPLSPTLSSPDPYVAMFMPDPRLAPLIARRATNARGDSK